MGDILVGKGVVAREQMEGWVTPGATYKVTLWGPEPTAFALVGEVKVVWSPPEIKGDRPQVVLANPIIYRTNVDTLGRKVRRAGGALPSFIANSTPYRLDSSDKVHMRTNFLSTRATLTTWGEVDDNPVGPAGALNPAHTVFGFGPHGFERRAVGPSMEKYFAELQGLIKAELAKMLASR